MASSLPPPSPSPHDERAASLLDGCPTACGNTEIPYDTEPTSDGFRCAYRCSDCGETWTTSWKV